MGRPTALIVICTVLIAALGLSIYMTRAQDGCITETTAISKMTETFPTATMTIRLKGPQLVSFIGQMLKQGVDIHVDIDTVLMFQDTDNSTMVALFYHDCLTGAGWFPTPLIHQFIKEAQSGQEKKL